MKFSNAVLQIRECLNLSQMAFAKELGISFVTVNRWENKVQKPSHMAITMLKAFCEQRGLHFYYTEAAEEEAEQ